LRTSVPGTSHAKAKTPCQDAHAGTATRPHGESFLVLACADGAGSAARSEEGAAAATSAFVRAACVYLETGAAVTRESILECFRIARAAIEARAVKLEIPSRELACTLLGAVVGEEHAWFAQIGDGLIVVGEEGGKEQKYLPVFWPRVGDYLNDSDFLTGDRFEAQVQFAERSAPAELSLSTDGLQLLMANLSARTIHQGFFTPIFAQLRQAEEADELLAPLRDFLSSDKVNQRTDDDKTLLLAMRDDLR
jgi:Protein phosphatase 2C